MDIKETLCQVPTYSQELGLDLTGEGVGAATAGRFLRELREVMPEFDNGAQPCDYLCAI